MWFFVFLFFLPLTLLYLGLMVVAALYFAMGVKQLTLPGNRLASRTVQSAWLVLFASLCAMSVFTWCYFHYIWFW